MLIPHLHFCGDCCEAISFYDKAFNIQAERIICDRDHVSDSLLRFDCAMAATRVAPTADIRTVALKKLEFVTTDKEQIGKCCIAFDGYWAVEKKS